MAPPTKTCTKCSTTKPTTDFSKDVSRKDGLTCRCKSCDSVAKRKWNAENKEHKTEYDRAWKAAHPNEVKAHSRKHYAENTEYHAAYNARRRVEHPDRLKANSAVSNAIRNATLTRPSECSACSKSCKPEGHHTSYDKRFHLDVVWLCRSCHKRLHAELKKHEVTI